MRRIHEREIERLLREIVDLQREILKYVRPPLTSRIFIAIGEDMSPATINVGQSIPATIVPLAADGVTPSGGAVSNPTWSVSDSAVATLTENADGSATLKGVAAGTVTVNVTATVTDTDGSVNTFSGMNTLSVQAPPPAPLTASIAIQFGTAS